jgi:hypothetical protein
MAITERSDDREQFDVRVTRSDGAVIVAAIGPIDQSGRARLVNLLEDLIDGQGNLTITTPTGHWAGPGALASLQEPHDRSRMTGEPRS